MLMALLAKNKSGFLVHSLTRNNNDKYEAWARCGQYGHGFEFNYKGNCSASLIYMNKIEVIWCDLIERFS